MKHVLKKIINLSLMTMLLFSYSCASDEYIENAPTNDKEKTLTVKMSVNEANAVKIKKLGSSEISEKEAIALVRDRFMNKNKSFVVNSCKKVSLPGIQTRNSEEETGYYVVEFGSEGNEGFSIVSADRRVEEVFAFSELGSLNDTVYNEGLKLFCNRLPYYIKNKINNFNTDSLYNAVVSRIPKSRINWIDDGCVHYYYAQYGFIPDPDFVYMGEETQGSESQSGIILTTKWHQESPYNNKLPYVSNDKRAYVGCAIVAMLQIMAYHKVNYETVTTSDWINFTQTSQCYDEELQDCILSIFNSIPNKDVTVDGTGISAEKIRDFLNKNGYVADLMDYDSNKMRYPAYVRGTDRIDGEGHAWVVDSEKIYHYITYDKYEKDDGYDIWRIYVEKQEDFGPIYVHCNWGWGGSSDGWYKNEVFSKSNTFDYTINLRLINVKPRN